MGRALKKNLYKYGCDNCAKQVPMKRKVGLRCICGYARHIAFCKHFELKVKVENYTYDI